MSPDPCPCCVYMSFLKTYVYIFININLLWADASVQFEQSIEVDSWPESAVTTSVTKFSTPQNIIIILRIIKIIQDIIIR